MKKRAQRATSNVFAMFDQAQIQEFKEVRRRRPVTIVSIDSLLTRRRST